MDPNGNDTAAAAAAAVGTGGRIDVPFAQVSSALDWLWSNNLADWTIWVFPGQYNEISNWYFRSNTGSGNLRGTTIKLNGSCDIVFSGGIGSGVVADGSIRMHEPGWFSIIGDAPKQGLSLNFGGARIFTNHYQQTFSWKPSPQIYLGDGNLSIGGSSDGYGDEMKLKLHNIQFNNEGSLSGSNGYAGSNIILGRHGILDFEIDNCKFITTDAVNMAGQPDYTSSGGPTDIYTRANWYFTNTTWITQRGQGSTGNAYPNWELIKFSQNSPTSQKVLVHNSKFTVLGRYYFTGDSSGNSGHIITYNLFNIQTHWWMSWSNNVFYAPNQQIGNAPISGSNNWYMWDEINSGYQSNYLDLLGSSISDNQIVGSGGGPAPFGGVFLVTMGNMSVALIGNNIAGSIMDYVQT